MDCCALNMINARADTKDIRASEMDLIFIWFSPCDSILFVGDYDKGLRIAAPPTVFQQPIAEPSAGVGAGRF